MLGVIVVAAVIGIGGGAAVSKMLERELGSKRIVFSIDAKYKERVEELLAARIGGKTAE